MPIQQRSCFFVVFIALLSLLGAPIWADQPAGADARAASNGQRILPADADVVEDVVTLTVASGVAPPFGTAPYSVAELRQALSRVERQRLSDAGRRLYRRVLEELDRDVDYRDADGEFRFNADASLTTEAYYTLRDGDVPYEYGYEERQPILSFPLEAWAGDAVYGFIGMDFRKNYPRYDHYEIGDASVDTVNPDPWSNIPFDLREIGVQFPHRGFLSFGGDHWNLQFGRDALRWGYGRTGTLFVSDYADYHDYVRLTGFWDAFSFSTFWLSLESWLRDEEAGPSQSDDVKDLHKSYLAHRFDFRLFDRLNLSYTEAIVFGRDDLELRFLNPMVSYHNWFANPELTNAIMSFEAEATLMPGFLGYAAFISDQWSAPLEDGSYTEEEPNAFGYLAGLDWRRALGDGFLRASGEWVRTDPWIYIGLHPLVSHTSRRRVQAENSPSTAEVLLDKPLGYYGGPDFQIYSLLLSYRVPGSFGASIKAETAVKGENTIARSLPPEDEGDSKRVTPSGKHPQRKNLVSLRGTLDPGALTPVWDRAVTQAETELGSELSLIWMKNQDAERASWVFDLQVAAWLSFTW
jgi:hypothetical protein